ncbi:hypothetical protein COOONC_20393 [Cooperia oncophora]
MDQPLVTPLYDDRYPVLVKKDISDPKSPKFIGTYSVKRNRIVYLNEKDEKIFIKKVSVKAKKGSIHEYKVETLCVTRYK